MGAGPLRPVSANAGQAPADAPPRHDSRDTAQAGMIGVYAGLLGQKAVTSDVLEAMAACRPAGRDLQIARVNAGLQATGLLTELRDKADPAQDHWPALALMNTGQIVLVIGQSRGDLVIYEPGQDDKRTLVPLAEFAPHFSGRLIKAEAPLEALEQAHVPRSNRAHWFWGEFHRYRGAFAEVALGSFVANLLAVAVALFALQVYDRVIPHQSEATLWVLAIGVLVALMMESFLKIARAQLIDGAGRQIELTTQKLLMARILGMRSDTPGRQPSTLFSSMREFGSVREFFTASTVSSLADIPFIFLFLMLVASIAGNVVWVLVIGGILMVIPGFVLQSRMIRLTRETQGASAKAGRLLHEAVFELDTIKTQRAEDRFQRVWMELTALSALKTSEQRKLASILTFWSQGVQQATYVAAVIMGTYLVFAGQFTVGAIIATGILTSRTLAPLTQLAGTMARWGNRSSTVRGRFWAAGLSPGPCFQ